MSSRFLAAGLAALLLASPILANGAPPFRLPATLTSNDAKLVVHVDANAKKPVLRVPASLVTAVKKEEPKREGGALLDNPATVIAGLALCAAFVSGGFWLLRGRGGRAAVVALCIACLALVGGTAFGDLILPRPPVLPAVQLPGNVKLSSDVTIVTHNGPGNTIELIIPAEKADPAPKTEPAPKTGEKPPEKPVEKPE
jgi:hypothetical protein